MYILEQIYRTYVQAYRDVTEKPRRSVKDFDKFINKFPHKRELIKLTGLFNSFWANIEPYLYFKLGFKQYGNGFNLRKASLCSNFLTELYKTIITRRNQVKDSLEKECLESLIVLKGRLGEQTVTNYMQGSLLKDVLEHKINLFVFNEFIGQNKVIFYELSNRGFIHGLADMYSDLQESNEIKLVSLKMKRKVNDGIRMILKG